MRLPLLIVHIAAGSLGILSGFIAIFLDKGSNRHRMAGKVFVISMVSMATAAVFLALMKRQSGNVLGGVFTSYLVVTAWLTARRRDGETSSFDWLVLLIPLAAGIDGGISGFVAVHSPTSPK